MIMIDQTIVTLGIAGGIGIEIAFGVCEYVDKHVSNPARQGCECTWR